MISRRLHALEVSLAIAIAKREGGEEAPTLDTLLAWHRLVQDAKEIGEEIERRVIGEMPEPAPQQPQLAIRRQPRLSVIQGGAA